MIWSSLTSLVCPEFHMPSPRILLQPLPSQIQIALVPQSNGKRSVRWLLDSDLVFREYPPHHFHHALIFVSLVFRIFLLFENMICLLVKVDIMNSVEKKGMQLYGQLAKIEGGESARLQETMEDFGIHGNYISVQSSTTSTLGR